MILLDTNILIEVLKNNEEIVRLLNGMQEEFAISSITQMELYYGAFNKAEIRKLEKFFANFEIIYLNEEIARVATDLIKRYAKSHNLDIPDSLIAASAIVHNCTLFTLNKRDFWYIDNIKLLEV